MTMTIGRTSLRVSSLRVDGDTVSIVGAVLGTDSASVDAARQRLTGMVNSLDQNAVPVTWTVEPSFDGYYVVVSADVSEVGPHPSRTARVAVTLARFSTAYASVVHETLGTVVTRTNVAGATAAATWAIPSSASFDPPNGWKNTALSTRVTSTGTVNVVPLTVSSSAITGRFTVPASAHYEGAATIEHRYSAAGAYHVMEGRHAPLSPSSWRLSNGLLRITPSTTANHLIDVSAYDGSAWSTATAWTVSASNKVPPNGNASGRYPQIMAARIVKNAPEAATIRLIWRYTDETTGAGLANRTAVTNAIENQPQVVDITLRRGDRVASLDFSNRVAAVPYITLSLNGTPGGSSITGGVVETSADASGNKAVILGAGTLTAPTTVALEQQSTSGSAPMQFAIGYVVPAAAATPDAATDLAGQYFGAVAEKQRAVLA